jgi:hypothetical protein
MVELERLESRELKAANIFVNPASGDLTITFEGCRLNTADVYAPAPGLVAVHAVDGTEETTVTFPAYQVQKISYTAVDAVFADCFNWTDVPETVKANGEQLQFVVFGNGSLNINAKSTGYAAVVNYGSGQAEVYSESPFTISLLNRGSHIRSTGFAYEMWK